MNWIQKLFRSKKVDKPKDSALNKHNVIKSVCVHLRGSIIIKDDVVYAECKKCGELY